MTGLDTLVDLLAEAGLVEEYVNDAGEPAMRLNPDGERVARQLAMLGEAGRDALLAGRLDALEDDL